MIRKQSAATYVKSEAGKSIAEAIAAAGPLVVERLGGVGKCTSANVLDDGAVGMTFAREWDEIIPDPVAAEPEPEA